MAHDIALASDYGLPAEQVCQLGEITLDIHDRARQSGENYVAIGQRLTEAKNLLKHGEFVKWLEEATGINKRTAERMMQVAETFKSDTVSLLRPAALIELSKGNVPESARKEAVQRAKNGQQVTKSVAKKIVAKHTPSPEPAWIETNEEPVLTDEDWDAAEAETPPVPTRRDLNAAVANGRHERREATALANGSHPIDKTINKALGELTRAIDARHKSYPDFKAHREAGELIDGLIGVWKAWKSKGAA